jgi:hypothetical protein
MVRDRLDLDDWANAWSRSSAGLRRRPLNIIATLPARAATARNTKIGMKIVMGVSLAA